MHNSFNRIANGGGSTQPSFKQLCRICGQILSSARKKTSIYSCFEYITQLRNSISVVHNDPLIHPTRSCKITSTTSKMADQMDMEQRSVIGNHARRMGALHAFMRHRHRRGAKASYTQRQTTGRPQAVGCYRDCHN